MRTFKFTICFAFILGSPSSLAQDCHFVFNSGTTPIVRSLIRLRMSGARTKIGPKTLSRFDAQPTPKSDSGIRRMAPVNPYMTAFQRAFNSKAIYPHNLDWALNLLKEFRFRSELDSEDNKQYSFISLRGRGHEITLSKLAAVYVSAFRENAIRPRRNYDYELSDAIKNAAPVINFANGQKKLTISLTDIADRIAKIIPPSATSAGEFYNIKLYHPEEFIKYETLRDGLSAAIDAVALVGGVDVLSALIGRENLYGLYFDLLADLRARTRGERFESARLRIFSEEQLDELANHNLLNEAIRELATTDFHQPNFEIIVALGLKYLNSDLSRINAKAVRNYVEDREEAKDFIPDNVFDSLQSQGYAPSDFRYVMKVLYTKQENYFDRGLITFNSPIQRRRLGKRDPTWELNSFTSGIWLRLKY